MYFLVTCQWNGNNPVHNDWTFQLCVPSQRYDDVVKSCSCLLTTLPTRRSIFAQQDLSSAVQTTVSLLKPWHTLMKKSIAQSVLETGVGRKPQRRSKLATIVYYKSNLTIAQAGAFASSSTERTCQAKPSKRLLVWDEWQDSGCILRVQQVVREVLPKGKRSICGSQRDPRSSSLLSQCDCWCPV